MSAIYDNWERLVAAVIKKQQLWELFHAPSRTPSVLSDASDSDSDSSLSFHPEDFFNFSLNLVIFTELWLPFVCKNPYLGSAKLLGRGTFGSVYSAAMYDGTTIVVKRLTSGVVSDLDFKRHMDIVGHVRHQNVAPLHAYHSSENERILLYDYYGGGSVYSLLHGQTNKNQARVDWDTRLKIAIGAARGIAHIHTLDDGKLVHGNIKSLNILLSPQQTACVSDLGLASMLETTFTPAALCYAPEVKKDRSISQASDVYSFGILLFELLTGKSSAHVPGGPNAVDLVKLIISSKSRETAAKIFDADLLQDLTIRDGMVEMLQIGIKCVAKSTRKRPKMNEVMKMLEEIVKINPRNHTSLSQK